MTENQHKTQTSSNIARSIGYGFLSWILPIGLSIYATPKILNGLGHTDYGVYVLILGFISYSFTFSIGRTATKYIAEFRQTGLQGKIQDVISATLFLNLIVGVFGAVIIVILANQLTVNIFKVEFSLQNITIQSLYVAAATIFVMMLSQVFSGIIQGLHRFDVYSNIMNFNSFSTIIGNIILIYFKQGLLILLLWSLLTTTVTCILYYIYAKLLLPEFKLSLKFSRNMLRLASRFSFGIVAYQIFANLTFLIERGLITREFGTDDLTYYVLPLSLGLYIHGVISSLTLVVFPLASELNNQPEKLLKLYIKSTKIVCTIVFFIAGTLITSSRFFLHLWLGAEIVDKSTSLLIIHTITFSILAILIISWQLREGLGYAITNGVLGFLWFIISVPLMYISSQSYGLEEIGVARLVGLVPIFLATFYFEKKIFDEFLFGFWFKLLSVLGIATILMSFAEYPVLHFLPISWMALLVSAICGGIVFLICLWMFRFFTRDEIEYFNKLVKR